jgi:spore coat protein U-like protein
LLASVGISAPAIAGTCTISTVPVIFGNYTPSNATALDGVGSVITICNNIGGQVANPVFVGIDGGGSSNINARRMTSGANTLNYQLYKDATRITVWGDTGAQRVNYNGRNRTATTPIYGRVPALQNVAAGIYSDTLTVTVTF